jgi:hypothetical protein
VLGFAWNEGLPAAFAGSFAAGSIHGFGQSSMSVITLIASIVHLAWLRR